MTKTSDNEFVSNLRAAVARLTKKLRKQSPTAMQLSLTERSTMAQLEQHKTLLPSELAAMEMITNQSMSQVLNHLFELGYIARTPSETDKRKVIISLTTWGQHTLLRLRHERDEWLTRAINETCSPEEQELLRKAIVPLTKLVDFKG